MIDQVLPDIYRIELPLPRNPLKALNCYVIKGADRHLIVDTGMNREECRIALFSGLAEIGVDIRDADVFLTHMHADHSGLVAEVAAGGAVYCSGPDAVIVNNGSPWEEMRAGARLNGFPEDLLAPAIENHPAYKYRASAPVNITTVEDGDVVSAGEYSFRCLFTPGHTRGHMCLYEPGRKLLLSGDHILGDITPNISLWFGRVDALGEYLESLDRVWELEVAVALPSHRRIIPDCRGRIAELRRHHRERAAEVFSILEAGPRNAYQVASRMTWDMRGSFEQFPVSQKWFATGEAIAHLRYLEVQGILRSDSGDNGHLLWMRSKGVEDATRSSQR